MNREPSNFWFLIPVIAGGFALVLLGALTPIISIIYGVPCAEIAAGLGYLIFPNLMMMVLLYGGDLAVVLEPVSMFMFLTVSLYYLLPCWGFGENLFLDETVISPHGMAGIWASLMIWTVVVVITVTLLNLVARLINSTTNRGT